jgi:glycosyltransferase involved in cell wall biosynthesis
MRIAIFSPAWFPVPPDRYGGIESIVCLLAEGLAAAGADVTLFASGDSTADVPLVSAHERAPSERIGQSFWELQHALPCLERAREFDVIHDHSGLLGLTLFGLNGCPLLHTVHGPLTGEPGMMYERICRLLPSAGLVSLTLSQRKPLPALNWVANVNNGLDVSCFPFDRRPEDFLLFLGRMSPDKGAHHAIAAARQAGLPLKIAAKCREPGEIEYFNRFVEPHLDSDIEYVGEVTHAERCELLRRASALLVPIQWEEPFGLTMIEAMACGTPVVAFRRGSVSEILQHGRTGFIVDGLEEMVRALAFTGTLDPNLLRAEATSRFSVEAMVDGYLDAYEAVRPSERRVSRLRARPVRRKQSVESMSGISTLGDALALD